MDRHSALPWPADDPPRQGLGLMRLRETEAADVDRDPVRLVHAAIDAGVTFLDTADMYGNERLVGSALSGRRDEVLLASKFGVVWGKGDSWSVRADRKYVAEACEASLRRLGVDTIDLYYLHHRSDETPIEETVSAMADLIDAGKIRAIGLSNVTEQDLRRAHAIHPIAALQEQHSLVAPAAAPFSATLAELGIALVAHSPTGHGVLHGDEVRHDPVGAAVVEVAARVDATPGQVALAWVHHQHARHGHAVIPLPGTSSVDHLRLNVAASELAISPDDLALLDRLATPVTTG